ncbi:hypothetical protein [Sphingopyxis sp. GW247-27LB]|uniref:hypothetical protein n=1 Tax=Sphingopyxis sp. GW247-27LB TaxID=2012632 RepID=UPI000BA5BED5|nr:hypothetical protein [Sphingopyxis sp. GW247-27LB]PAL23547.1 hypothetical protein CD928_05625 [Sphingopyxis sp. GW247-27LB]
MRGTARLMLCLLLTIELCRIRFDAVTYIQLAFIGGTVTGLLFSSFVVKITRNVIRTPERDGP